MEKTKADALATSSLGHSAAPVRRIYGAANIARHIQTQKTPITEAVTSPAGKEHGNTRAAQRALRQQAARDAKAKA